MFSNSFKYCNSLLLVLFLAFMTSNIIHYEKNNGNVKTFQKKDSENNTYNFEKYELNSQFSDSEKSDEGFEYFTSPILFSLKIKTNYFSQNSSSSISSRTEFSNSLCLYDLFCEWRSDC